MTREELKRQAIALIRTWQDPLDRAIAQAGERRLQKLQHLPNLPHDLRCATDEAWSLSRGNDLRYDRPTTGLLYGLWYHPQRVTTCLPQVLDSLLDANLNRPLQVYDLGAGTGAFQWAFAICAAALHRLSPTRSHEIHIVNVDSSAIMLNHLEDLWDAFRQNLPQAAAYVTYQSTLNSYTTQTYASTAQKWITASYLFDHTDKVGEVVADFARLIDQVEPARVLLSTSQQKGDEYLPQIREQVLAKAQTVLAEQPSTHADYLYGLLPHVNRLRETLATVAEYPQRIRPNARWASTYHRNLTLRAPTEAFAFAAKPDAVEIEMFRPRLPPRTKLVLSPEQEDACKLGAQATAIFGPAGSGKSVILSERIKRLVEERDYDFDLRILVTTFNKKLVTEVLSKWLRELLDPARIYHGSAVDGTDSISFKNKEGKRSGVPNIQLLNFDKLPTRIARVHTGAFAKRRLFGDGNDKGYEGELFEVIDASVDHVRGRLREDFDTTFSSVKHVLNAQYIEEDLHRIIYGKQYESESAFMAGPRPGRRLDRNATPRKVLWSAIAEFVNTCSERQIDSYLSRRVRLRRVLDEGKYRNSFTHIFVDELQDCGDADFSIFFGLVADPNNLCVTGDLAQAVHLGKSSGSSLPRYNHFFGDGHPNDANKKQSDWKYITFVGSYRLPFRISEALIPLSEAIGATRSIAGSDDSISVVLQHPYKGSPPGVRIIIVAADDETAMAEKICSIRGVYCLNDEQIGFDASPPVIMERDQGLRDALQKRGVSAETDTILRLKGLEYGFVIWSTRATIPGEDDHLEYAYTILTRTSGMAVVALFPDASQGVREVLATFQREEVICWDEVSAELALVGEQPH